jgi:Arc/MetJ family transcription regulator
MLKRTSIKIDIDLLEEARKASSLKTNDEIVRIALEEFIARRKRAGLLKVCRPGLWDTNLEEMRTSP